MERIASGRTAIIYTLIAAGGLLGSTAMLCAGPLDPPAGAVAPTYKTLSEVEPRTVISTATTPGDSTCTYHISMPGSYYFPGNLGGSPGKMGIKIDANDVTIDLCGFEFEGRGGGMGIGVSGWRIGVTIRNGTVRGWNGSGIDLAADTVATAGPIENIVTTANATFGLRGGARSIIRSCTAYNNTSYGIIVYDGGVAESCASFANGGNGFGAGPGATIRDCMARENTGAGIDSSGFATISHCTCYLNTWRGISVGLSCLVESCTASANGSDGIGASGNCTVISNVCEGNGRTTTNGAGVRATGSRTRVEGNNCTAQDLGIAVDVSGCVIVRNTCAGNTTNWSIVANNVYGPIIDRTAPGSAAVNGNSAADALGSTHANANFSY